MSHARLALNFHLILLTFILASLAPVQAGTILVGSGAEIDTGQGQMVLGCNDLQVAGRFSGNANGAGNVSTLNGGSLITQSLSFSGDWENAGQSNVPGSVRWLDGCNVMDAQMTGVTNFSALEISTTNGRTARLQANATQQVSNSLILQGAQGALLMLRSTASGQRAGLSLAPGASQSIAFVDVADIDASGGQSLAAGTADQSNSVDSGNNLNWFQGVLSAVAIPTLGFISTLFLILLIALMGLLRARHMRLSHEATT